ncbi:baseplate J/gp47 family protein [Methanobrevibacter ruminantium]|uniref:baseplate J/gp47 family protein n=1 Tax=Methanobrevibacter ruminantium TaxID=83816 RepID=UPI0026F339CA|nr:baseplate J/gp47 family protein [Methanobrevibacter ruminantium]
MVEEDTEFITFDGVTISKSDYRDEIINKYIRANIDGLTKITDFSIGSEAYHISDMMASLMLEHRELTDLNYRMSMIHTAEGEFLDNFGDPAGVHRYGSSPSQGEVTFNRLNTESTNQIIIPDGLVVSTEDAISFVVDNDGENITMDSGVNNVTCNVLCEQEGAYTNVLPETVTLIMNDLASQLSVTNVSEMSGGRDIEGDDDYRSRILLSPFAVPAGTLGWYENVALTLESIHDVKVEKGLTQVEKDIKIIYNPVDWSDTSIALNDLTEIFAMKEYNAAGVTLDFILCSPVPVLTGANVVYFALLLDINYTIDMVKDSVIEKINQFNDDALIEIEFNPGSLASIIENEIEGIDTCRIVEYDSTNERYTEIVEPITLEENEKYVVDLTGIETRIREMRFNLDIELEE